MKYVQKHRMGVVPPQYNTNQVKRDEKRTWFEIERYQYGTDIYGNTALVKAGTGYGYYGHNDCSVELNFTYYGVRAWGRYSGDKVLKCTATISHPSGSSSVQLHFDINDFSRNRDKWIKPIVRDISQVVQAFDEYNEEDFWTGGLAMPRKEESDDCWNMWDAHCWEDGRVEFGSWRNRKESV